MDFSTSGIDSLPALTAATLRDNGDQRVVGWLREAVQEGDRINRDDPSFDRAEVGMRYVVGDQRDPKAEALPYLPRMIINESRKVTQAHASVLTDLKPVWSYKAQNPTFQQHGDLLNRLVISWYVSTQADIELGNWVKYSAAAGTADLMVEWDPHAQFGGNHRIMARDFRDTLPWRPASGSRSEQDWQGVIFREEHTVNVLRGMFPTRAALFIPTTDSLLGTLLGRFRSMASRLVSPQTDTLSGLSGGVSANQKPRSGNVLFYRCFLNDLSRNLTLKDIPMGPPGAAWAYVVPPGGRMYPNKRLIVGTPDAIISDGPSPYWHAMFPFARLKLWEVPWQFLGVGLLNDLIPIQDGINENTNDLRLAIKQWMDPKTVYDRQAVSETFMKLYDPRRPGAKIKTNPTYGDGFKQLDGPAPQVMALALEFIRHLTDKFSDLSGIANLQALLQLRQMPGADTIRQYYEAMTPELRAEGRMMEAAIRNVAEMVKVNTFQFMTQAKRVTILGDAGMTLDDFDFDPANLIPALEEGQPGYTPELDTGLPQSQRAQFFHKLLVFIVAPNSMLAMNAQEQKLLRLQLSRMGLLDFWSLMESLEIPNVGSPPPMPLPPLRPPTPQEVMLSMAGGEGKFTIDPMSGQILEIRVPTTITERLQAQMLLGIGQTTSAAGRPPTAQAMPHSEPGKKDSTGTERPVVSESRKD